MRLQQWIFQRGDHGGHAYLLVVICEMTFGVVAGASTTRPASCSSQLSEEAEAGDDVVHVQLGFDQAFAGVQGFGQREFSLARHQPLRRLQQEVAALRGRHAGPDASRYWPYQWHRVYDWSVTMPR